MIFDWRTVLVVGPIVIFVMWVVKTHSEYEQIFRRPRQTWVKMEWWKVLLVSLPILILSLKFFPMLENFISSHIGEVVTDVGGTSQEQIIQKSSEQVGIRPALILSGVFFGIVAGMEEIVFRGVILHFLKRQRGWIFGLIISSLLFGLMHLSEAGMTLSMFVYTTVLGVIFGSVYLKFGLMSPVIIHSGYNFFLMLMVSLNL